MTSGSAPEFLRQAWAAGTGAGLPALEPVRFEDLAGFAADDHREAFALFAAHAASILPPHKALRPAVPPTTSLREVCRRAGALANPSQAAAKAFFEAHFRPFRLRPKTAAQGSAHRSAQAPSGFVTGYYEPVVEGSLAPTEDFTAPLLARPDDLIGLAPGESLPGLPPGLCAARRLQDGTYCPYPDRAAIEAGALEGHAKALAFLADKVEVFFAQVQGSARLRLGDGRELRLTYAGRNGHPYTSIGRILVETGEIQVEDMGLERVKAWIRAKGQNPGEPGDALMLRNKSYVFFALNRALAGSEGPIGGAGLSLEPLRSIAIDRSIWSYGLPFWLDAELPWRSATPEAFRRLMIAADTGSAILGPARADIFFGSGEAAGARAGSLRHACAFTVLLPREDLGASP